MSIFIVIYIILYLGSFRMHWIILQHCLKQTQTLNCLGNGINLYGVQKPELSMVTSILKERVKLLNREEKSNNENVCVTQIKEESLKS